MHAMDLVHACNRMITNCHGLQYVHVANNTRFCRIMKCHRLRHRLRQRHRYRYNFRLLKNN